MLDALTRRGRFGQDYVRALASAAGLFVYGYEREEHGIDLGLRLPGRAGGVASPGVEVLVRSWPQAGLKPCGAEWEFADFDEVQFTRLAGDDFTVPRFLVLVLVPAESSDWAEFKTEGMLVRHLAYYRSLRDESPIEEPSADRARPVRVPTANVLTARSLHSLIHPVDLTPRSPA